jgi:hypothetical protein
MRAEAAAVRLLVSSGEGVIDALISRIECVMWEDSTGWREGGLCLRVLVAMGAARALAYVRECVERLISSPEWQDDVQERGLAAIDALATSDDPAVHEWLRAWAMEIEHGWDDLLIWHLLDAARPYLDDRAVPMLTALLEHPDIQDVVPAARAALKAVASGQKDP